MEETIRNFIKRLKDNDFSTYTYSEFCVSYGSILIYLHLYLNFVEANLVDYTKV